MNILSLAPPRPLLVLDLFPYVGVDAEDRSRGLLSEGGGLLIAPFR
jgi:hypothetical protein